MDWKTVAENVLKLKNLADNEEIKNKLESLSLYNCRLKELLDGTEAGAEIQSYIEKEDELENNTLAKIQELQKETERAATPEEEASKIIECFLYIDNYLSLYCEPELFFIQPQKELHLCDSVELLNSKNKFEDIIQSMFFFQELNTKTHVSLQILCNFLRVSKTNVSEFIDNIDFVIDKLDFLNKTVLEREHNKPDDPLKNLYPFILIINCTAQRLMLHRFTGIYPANINKKVFEEALKQKEHILDRIKGKIIKRAEFIKQLRAQITEPMNQEVLFDSRCVTVEDENIVAKRETPEQDGDPASIIITTDKINRCCTAAYWTAFLMTNEKKLAAGERNAEADEWFSLYLSTAKSDKYQIPYSLRAFIIEKQATNSRQFNDIKIKPQKKETGPSVLKKVMPLWMVFAIAAALSAGFVYFIILGTKSIIH